eukprot:CAMPEP_0170137908 /NCGR_PEP_ID=MMETSP0033_2-20121228/4525_1 /TAXON_ID=195969 /ORGANISM="Dolichomastix tenuilepis, Strain CCMP3274" /LENGTH=113 /DNA_ID=CAMNT_0010373849 /DNA_START=36 /DNA_END=377 /DNA_ORIENTATION=+
MASLVKAPVFLGATRARAQKVHRRGGALAAKKDIHKEFYPEAEVYCNGELVMKVGGTQERYDVDLWSGNHPFFQGNKNALIVQADGNLKKFQNKYADLDFLVNIDTMDGSAKE